jgi:hypothetical protein
MRFLSLVFAPFMAIVVSLSVAVAGPISARAQSAETSPVATQELLEQAK